MDGEKDQVLVEDVRWRKERTGWDVQEKTAWAREKEDENE